MPAMPRSSLQLIINWKEPIQLSSATKRIKQLIKNIQNDLLYYDAHVGEDQYLIHQNTVSTPSTATVYLKFQTQNQEALIKKRIATFFQTYYPSAEWDFRPESSVFELLFPEEEEAIKVAIYTNNQTIISQRRLLGQVADSLNRNFSDLQIKEPSSNSRLLLVPKTEHLLSYKVNRTELYEKLQQVLNGISIFTLNQFKEKLQVVIGNHQIGSIEELLSKTYIVNADKQLILLKHLVQLEYISGWENIEAANRGVYLPLSVNTDQKELVLDYLQTLKKQSNDYTLSIDSSFYENRALFRELMLVLLAALALLYLIMTAQFESFLQPLIILLEIPISLSGSLLFLYCFGNSINLMAMIGMVVTVGIVINDSIIKIDTINRLVSGGMSLKSAIHQGGIKRLNPIIMTTLTTILAIFPILFSKNFGAILQYPLALTLTGGLMIGTLMSLYLIPLVYHTIYKTINYE